MMKRKIVALIVVLIAVSLVSTGCFFGTTTNEKSDAYLEIEGQGYVEGLREGENRFEKDASVDLKARPDDGWEFKRWEGAADKYKADTSVLMNRDRSVKVVFEKKDTPVKEVSFEYERIARREYKFTATEPSGAVYWEWKFPDESYWHGYEDENEFTYRFSSSGEKEVKVRIKDKDGEIIGQTSKKIDVY